MDIQGIITEYFSRLFSTSAVADGLSEWETVQRVSDEHNVQLCLPITSEEVKAAVDAMHPDKSPECDGLNPGFYQAFWSIVGVDVIRFCQDFFDTGQLPSGINRTLVCLIPKVKQPQQMTDL